MHHQSLKKYCVKKMSWTSGKWDINICLIVSVVWWVINGVSVYSRHIKITFIL